MTVNLTAKPLLFRLPACDAVWVRQGVIAVAIALLTLAVRLPFAHFIDDDEAFYSLVGQRWLHGLWPYTGSFDVKPPLLFAMFAAVQAVFGMSLATIKGLEIACVIWGAIALQRLIARQAAWRDATPVSLWAGGLFPLLSLAQGGMTAANALLLSPFVISAVSAMSKAAETRGPEVSPLRQVFLAGLWIGLAGMVKQTAVFEALGLAGFALWHFRGRRPVQVLLVFVAGAALPALAFAAGFAAVGHFGDMWQAVVAGAMARTSLKISGGPHVFWLLKFIVLMSPLAVLAGMAISAGLRRHAIAQTFPASLFGLAALWAFCASAGCIAGQSDLSYYAIPLIAPLLILSGAFVMSVAPRAGMPRYLTILGFAVAVLGQAAWSERDVLSGGLQSGDDYAAAHAAAVELKRLGWQPSDDLMTPQRGLFTFVALGATPRSRYFHSMHLMCHFPTPDPHPLFGALAARPRFIILPDPGIWLACEDAGYYRRLAATLKTDYALEGGANGYWSRYLIYELRPAQGRPGSHAAESAR